MANTDEQTWQRTCEQCGSELVQVDVQFTDADFSDEHKRGTPVVRDVCPNPECPRHRAEYAEIPSGTDDRPGSLGGDNGGG